MKSTGWLRQRKSRTGWAGHDSMRIEAVRLGLAASKKVKEKR
jgi:hypothetical protein